MTDNATILHDYLKEIERYYKLGIAKEHSYRSTLQTMLPKLARLGCLCNFVLSLHLCLSSPM
jgi:hypothetical protein